MGPRIPSSLHIALYLVLLASLICSGYAKSLRNITIQFNVQNASPLITTVEVVTVTRLPGPNIAGGLVTKKTVNISIYPGKTIGLYVVDCPINDETYRLNATAYVGSIGTHLSCSHSVLIPKVDCGKLLLYVIKYRKATNITCNILESPFITSV